MITDKNDKKDSLPQLNEQLLAKDRYIEQKDREYDKLCRYALDCQAHIWKLEKKLQYRSVRFWLQRAKKVILFLAKGCYGMLRLAVTQPGAVSARIQQVRKTGIKAMVQRIIHPPDNNETLELAADFVYPALDACPKISVVMPVYNVEKKWLALAVESVMNQAYENFELIIVDDGSTRQETRQYLQQLRGDKIVIRHNDTNKGISGASNEGVALATGTYVALLDNDDQLRENALYEVARAINAHHSDVIYSDEARVDEQGNIKRPFLKPDWSPDLLRSQMYVCHLLVFKKSLFEKAGGFDSRCDGSQDYDLMLRFSELTSDIYHIPKILYFWREIASSTAMNPEVKPAAHRAGLGALDRHVKRVFGPEAGACKSEYKFVYDVRYPLDKQVKASIIIPTRDQQILLAECVDSIIEKTSHDNYEILILDNNSREEKTRKWFEKITFQHDNIRVIDAFYPFNWSKLNNHGARHAAGDVLVFLNNDTLVIHPEWLTRICENACRPDIGVVGGLLLYEDDTIQHAGVVVGMGGWADHVFKKCFPVHYSHPFVSPMVARNVSAVTGACLGISRKVFEEINGLDENFIICGSDVEIALRTLKKGYVNLYNPYVRLYHLESKSRTSYIPDVDFEMSKKAYAQFLRDGDPYFNENLSLESLNPILKNKRI